MSVRTTIKILVLILFAGILSFSPLTFPEAHALSFPLLPKSKYLIKVKDQNFKKNISQKYGAKNFKQSKKTSQEVDKWMQADLDEYQLSKIKSDTQIQYVEKDLQRKLLTTPNDTYYSTQNNVFTGQFDQWDMRKINLLPTPASGSSAWDVTTGSSSTIVAVIDTGIDLTHPDLSTNIWLNSGEIGSTASEGPVPNCTSRSLPLDKSCNNLDDDGNGFTDDVRGFNFADSLDGNTDGKYDNPAVDTINTNVQDTEGHGTHVSGTIAAIGNNSQGVAGICWTCKIMPLKVINSQGFGYDSDIAAAIRYATDNGAKVINMSLGGPGYSQSLQDAVTYAWNAGVLVVSASGNDGTSASDSYPGGLDDSLSIGSSTYLDGVSAFSNHGGKQDMLAPGEKVLSTKLQTLAYNNADPNTYCEGNVNYFCLTGTSMASPHVAGGAALIFDYHRTDITPWNAKQVRYSLIKYANKLGTSGFDNNIGYGRENVLASLNGASLPADVTAPIASLSSLPALVNGTMNISGTASDANLYNYTLNFVHTSDNYIVKKVTGRLSITASTLTSVNTTTISDGQYSINMKVEDFAGNVTTSNTITFTIDNTPPSAFTVSAPTNNLSTTNPRPPFTWSAATDLHGPVTYDIYLNSSPYQTALSGTSFSPSSDIVEGSYDVVITAKDSLGNFRNANTIRIYIDHSPPADFSLNVSTSSSNATFTFSTTDTISGIARYDIQINSGTISTVTSPYVASLSDGSYSATVTAYDNAGNLKSSTVTFTIDARTPYLQSKADFNHDGVVNLTDLSILAARWQTSNSVADANTDNVTNLSDLSILAADWLKNY